MSMQARHYLCCKAAMCDAEKAQDQHMQLQLDYSVVMCQYNQLQPRKGQFGLSLHFSNAEMSCLVAAAQIAYLDHGPM